MAVVVGVVAVDGAVVAVVVVVFLMVVDVVVSVDVAGDVAPDDVDFVVQDAKTRDVTMRQVSTIQVIPLFIQTSYLLWDASGNPIVNLFSEYSQNIRVLIVKHRFATNPDYSQGSITVGNYTHT